VSPLGAFSSSSGVNSRPSRMGIWRDSKYRGDTSACTTFKDSCGCGTYPSGYASSPLWLRVIGIQSVRDATFRSDSKYRGDTSACTTFKDSCGCGTYPSGYASSPLWLRVIGIQSVRDATFTPGNADTRSRIL